MLTVSKNSRGVLQVKSDKGGQANVVEKDLSYGSWKKHTLSVVLLREELQLQ